MNNLEFNRQKEELEQEIREYRRAIRLTKSIVTGKYHTDYDISRRAIEKYKIELKKLEKKLQKLVDNYNTRKYNG